MTLKAVRSAVREYASAERARGYARFFKTGRGEYGYGDRFLGVVMPDIRRVVRQFGDAPRGVVEGLLSSSYHEERMCGLLIIVHQFGRADECGKKRLFDCYVSHISAVNNWDLVDVTAPHVVGAWLVHHSEDRGLIDRLAVSSVVWERRIAMVSMQAFINSGKFREPLRVARLLVRDKHDLIHKAVGWMLREIGKRDVSQLESFLHEHAASMPRTMLRYAIERLPERRRLAYLWGEIG